MKFYNTLTKEKQDFIPLENGKVKMYACGPTVYNYFHIGNARCFTVFDMLRRYLIWRGYDVKFVQNFTDIDDKMIKRANEENTTVKAVAEKYISEYFTDATGLGICPADVHPHATDNIDEIIGIVSTLIEKGYAYESNGDVYYSPLKFKGYGKLSHMPIEDLESGARIDVSEQKQDPLDFALWKAAKPGEPSWDSPWGKGRPGWHIECSAMVKKYLGDTIDIHCGGQDLCFPHHENEIAQSEAANGKPFVHYWLHNGYINVDNKKMSKSLNNFFTVRDVAKEYGYMAIRFFILSSHYRSPINYSTEILGQAKSALERMHTCQDSLKFYLETAPKTALSETEHARIVSIDAYRERFITVMDDDFNTADGIACIFDMVREANMMMSENASYDAVLYAKEKLSELVELMGFTKEETKNTDLEEEIKAAIEKRAAAKKAKDFATADAIRADLLKRGVVLEDTPNGTKYTLK